jgi:dienelactone hydrolase
MKTLILLAFTLALCPATTWAAVKTETITYKVGDTTCKGFLAYDDAGKDKRPGILVVHEFLGLNDYARDRAKQLAGLGYVAFAVDMYGDGKVLDPDHAKAMVGELRKNGELWLARAEGGLKILREHPLVDADKLASIGYCFGGTTSLKLAHSGAPLKAAVSFHGGLDGIVPTEDEAKKIKAKILICHGAMDSFIKEETIQKVRSAYEKGGVDYELIYLGGAVHSFTVPDADKLAKELGTKGIAYNAAADRRSWAAMRAIFDEAFAKAK